MIKVQTQDFNIAEEIASLTRDKPDIGAVVTFTGIVRSDSSSGHEQGKLQSLTLEHYPGMTEKELGRIERQALERWSLSASLIIHRYGKLEPGDNIVLVITASPHRKAAFEAAEFLMDYLKTEAPFWKLEEEDGHRTWVETRDSDQSARRLWD